jgi:hypothetical protein
MSATEVIEEIKKLPANDQREVFVFLAGKIMAGNDSKAKPWLGKKLTFDEACEIVFRENRELLSLLAK